MRVAAPGSRSAAAANRVLSDAGSLLSPEAGGGNGATGGLQLDVALQYDRGCRRAHASHLSVPIVQPFRWVSMLWLLTERSVTLQPGCIRMVHIAVC